MDATAMFRLTYGLFIAGVEVNGKKNACVINTASQATSEPNRMLVTMLKTNYTTELIRQKGSLAVSVLSLDCPLDFIAAFGMRSGRTADKFEGVSHKVDGNGNPYFDKNTIAYMSMKVDNAIDLGTHYVFIGEVTEAEKTGEGKAMTYGDYRTLKSGGTVAKGEDKPKSKKYVCSVCHYVYDGEIPFEELPDDYVCPVCGKPKSVFIAEE